MKYFICLLGLLSFVVFPFYAQNWTSQDSLRLQKLLKEGGEIKLNPEILKEIEKENVLSSPKIDLSKSWMDFDTSMPMVPKAPEKKVVLTLRPYASNTKYNWDPVYQKKITINKNTWRGDPFYELTTRFIYSNWAKSPLDVGPRETLEQIEATGIRYRVTERANNMAVGSWQPASGNGFSGDFLSVFTKDFWNASGRKRRARTLEVLKAYGDSTTVLIKHPVTVISER